MARKFGFMLTRDFTFSPLALFIDTRIVMPKKPLISEERPREQEERIAAQMDLVKKIAG